MVELLWEWTLLIYDCTTVRVYVFDFNLLYFNIRTKLYIPE